jgi:ribosomal protein L14
MKRGKEGYVRFIMHVERRGKKRITAHFGDVMIIVMRKAIGAVEGTELKRV